jgi:hypothetical protein
MIKKSGAHFTTSGFPDTNAFTFLAGGGLDLGVSRSVAIDSEATAQSKQ